MCILLTHLSKNGRSGRSLKPSTAKSRRFPRLSRDLRFLSKLAVSLAKLTVELEFDLANDFVCRFRPIKPVLLQNSRTFRIHILLNFEILVLEAYRFQNSEGQGWTGIYTLMVSSLSTKFIRNSHQNLLVQPIFRDKA